ATTKPASQSNNDPGFIASTTSPRDALAIQGTAMSADAIADPVEAGSPNGVRANQKNTVIPAMIQPIGKATNCTIQGGGSRSEFHLASGTKSGDVGTAPR